MKKLFFLLSIFAIILSCSSDETSTPVTPPAPMVKYTITLSAGEGGTVSTTGGEYEAGQTVSVTATPQGEYLFKDWSDGNTDATRTITVSSNSTLTANFEKKKYPLTVSIEGEGEVLEEIVNAGRTTDYDSGTTVKLTAVPAEGWEFIGWTGAIESTELEVQLLVSEAKEVNSLFEKSIMEPIISINNPSLITSTSAKIKIDIKDNGGGEITKYGLCWNSDGLPTLDDFKTVINDNYLGEKEIEIKGLLGSETYKVRAFAINNAGVSYSEVIELTTQNSSLINNCKLEDFNPSRGVGLGFPRNKYTFPSTGNLKVNLIFVDFDDAISTRTTEEVLDILSPISEDYFLESSYGKLNIELIPIHNWYRMSKNSDQYGWPNISGADHRAYIQEAANLADPDYDFTDSDAFLIIANPDAVNITNGPAFNGNEFYDLVVDNKSFYNSSTSGIDLDYWGGLWLNHEFIHNMGLPDLYNYSGNLSTYHGFVGEYSIMGLISGKAPDLFAFEKWTLNWIEDTQVVCADYGNYSALLTPLEKANGIKMIVYPISESKAIVVESRRKLGLDINMINEGPLVYVVDTKILTGDGVIKVLPLDMNNEKKYNSVMSVGEEIKFEGYTIKFLDSYSKGDLVEIIK